jgi:hypothetical protein
MGQKGAVSVGRKFSIGVGNAASERCGRQVVYMQAVANWRTLSGASSPFASHSREALLGKRREASPLLRSGLIVNSRSNTLFQLTL